jgi:phosphoribosyl-dephospho-CoA transferase
VGRQLPEGARAAWRQLCAALERCDATLRVHGSFGWQHVTRMAYTRRGSDVDICIAASDAKHADEIAALLQAWPVPGIRLDGELLFAGGRAIAWREWLAWRAGRVKAVLIKDLQGSRLAEAFA